MLAAARAPRPPHTGPKLILPPARRIITVRACSLTPPTRPTPQRRAAAAPAARPTPQRRAAAALLPPPRAMPPSKTDPFSAADAASSDDEDADAGPRLPPGRPFTPSSPPPQAAPQLHRHASHVHLAAASRPASPGDKPPLLPSLPARGPASTALFGPLVASVGVISDVQHAAGIEDGRSFHGVPRFYAAALEGARRAGDAFAREEGLEVVIHLGDTVDGQHALRGVGTSEQALSNVVDALVGARRGTRGGAAGDKENDDDDDNDGGNNNNRRRRRPLRLLNLTSNHDLYNFGGADRARLNALLGIVPPAAQSGAKGGDHDGASYFSAPIAPGWRAVGLDAYDVSMLGRAPGDARHAEAVATLKKNNPNGSDERPAGWDSPDGLKGVARRFVRFGGGAGKAQLAWLRAELAECRQKGERVLVLCHLPLHPATAPPACLLWNYEQVIEALEAFPGTVAATLTGHAHMNGYVFAPHGTGGRWEDGAGDGKAADEQQRQQQQQQQTRQQDLGRRRDDGGSEEGEQPEDGGPGRPRKLLVRGIHHLVLPCVLETPPDRDCWAVLDVHDAGLVLRGQDTCMTLAMACDRPAAAAAGAGGGEALADAFERVAISAEVVAAS